MAQNSFAINKKSAVLLEKKHVFDFEIKKKIKEYERTKLYWKIRKEAKKTRK